MKGKKIGIVLETKKDAKNCVAELDLLYHWREPDEIEAIKAAIQLCGHTVDLIGTPKQLMANYKKYRESIDFIFNLSVGFKSRFRLGIAPSLFEICEIPYSGADPYSKIATQNKHLLKSFLNKINIPTPEWIYVNSVNDLKNIKTPAFPCIIKPAHEGSSIGIDKSSVVNDTEKLHTKVSEVIRKTEGAVIVEQFISGRELKIGIIGNEQIRFIGIIEDIDEKGSSLGDKYLFFNAKNTGSFDKALIGKEENTSALLKDALSIYKYFLPMDFGTFDIRVNRNGEYYFLEFNTDATLHPDKTLAKCCVLNGVSYEKMIAEILKTSFERWGIK